MKEKLFISARDQHIPHHCFPQLEKTGKGGRRMYLSQSCVCLPRSRNLTTVMVLMALQAQTRHQDFLKGKKKKF